MKTWRTRVDRMAECLTCGDTRHSTKRSIMTWARKHATDRKHTVHVDVTHVRVYDGKP